VARAGAGADAAVDERLGAPQELGIDHHDLTAPGRWA
jgi:hypothetical protein